MCKYRQIPPSIIVKEALRGITSITPLIHRIGMSGNYNYQELKSKFGNLKIVSNFSDEPYNYNNNYNRQSCCHYKKIPIKIFTEPVKPFLPDCYLSIVHHDQKLLRDLNKVLPGLKIALVEYAIDFNCKNHEEVSDLFYLFRRYCYFPYAKNTTIQGEKFQGWKEHRQFNSVYKINASSKNNICKYRKLYERGIDKNKILLENNQKGWLHKDVYRLRFELTLKSRGRKLKDMNLRSLSKFIKNVKFHDVFFPNSGQDEIQFMHFKKHTKLPSEWEDYNARDREGNIESLQEEIFTARKLKINPSLFLETADLLDDFKNEIENNLKCFDRKWRLKKC